MLIIYINIPVTRRSGAHGPLGPTVLVQFGSRFQKFCWSWSESVCELRNLLVVVRASPRFPIRVGPGSRKFTKVLFQISPGFLKTFRFWSGLVLDFHFSGSDPGYGFNPWILGGLDDPPALIFTISLTG